MSEIKYSTMNYKHLTSIIVFLALKITLFSQTPIHFESEKIINWATNVSITRGYQNIMTPSLGLASFGEPSNGIGKADGEVVSLGDRGEAIITFTTPIINGEGCDFAVFENSAKYQELPFLELAFVEVSSNGVDFFRFPAVSNTQTATQTGGFDSTNPDNVYNLAGKHLTYYGTPFDLEELKNIDGLDINNITHIKIIDVVGSINPNYASYDSNGNIINDPFPTPFNSSGFDLDAVGVINQKATDHAPVLIKAIDNIIVDMNADAITFDLTKVFTDADGDQLTFEVESNNNADVVNATIAASNLTVSFVTNKTGEAVISVKASNGKAVSTQFSVKVNAVDNAPYLIKQIADIIVDNNSDNLSIDLTTIFADADGDKLKFELESNSNANVVNANIEADILTLSFDNKSSGESTITVKATANSKSVSTQFSVKVNGVSTSINSLSCNIQVYPNPCNGRFNVNVNDVNEYSWQLLDVNGRRVNSGVTTDNNTTIYVEESGVYIVKIFANGKVSFAKIIVK